MKTLGAMMSFGLFATMLVACTGRSLQESHGRQDPAAGVLARRITISCDGEPLLDVIDDLKRQSGVRIEVERGALPESFHQMPLVTCNLQNVALKKALQTILSPHGLSYLVEDRVVRVIGARERTGNSGNSGTRSEFQEFEFKEFKGQTEFKGHSTNY